MIECASGLPKVGNEAKAFRVLIKKRASIAIATVMRHIVVTGLSASPA